MAAACCNEDTDVLWELLEMGADTTVVDPQGLTALGHASLAGRLDSVELLLAYGANIKRNHAENALHQALSPHFNGDERQRAKMLHLLLRNGAKLDAVGKFGRTPFMEAVHYWTDLSIVRQLAKWMEKVEPIKSEKLLGKDEKKERSI